MIESYHKRLSSHNFIGLFINLNHIHRNKLIKLIFTHCRHQKSFQQNQITEAYANNLSIVTIVLGLI